MHWKSIWSWFTGGKYTEKDVDLTLIRQNWYLWLSRLASREKNKKNRKRETINRRTITEK